MTREGETKRREQVVGPMAERAVAVAVAVVAGQERAQGFEQVLVRARARLHEGQAGRGVGGEHRAQPVAPAGTEPLHIGGDVERRTPRGLQAQLQSVHPYFLAAFSGRLLWPPSLAASRPPSAPFSACG